MYGPAQLLRFATFGYYQEDLFRPVSDSIVSSGTAKSWEEKLQGHDFMVYLYLEPKGARPDQNFSPKICLHQKAFFTKKIVYIKNTHFDQKHLYTIHRLSPQNIF